MKRKQLKIIVDTNEFVDTNELQKVLNIARCSDNEVYLEKDLYEQLKTSNKLPIGVQDIKYKHDYSDIDLFISIGGDGTFLRAASKLRGSDIPILGVNAGRLGFLADTDIKDFEDAYNKFQNNLFVIEPRTMIEVSVDNFSTPNMSFALNEIAVLKQESASMITVETYIDGAFLSISEADGLMVATPTGSTAYSLSVGGPVVMANLPCFVINSIASHSLTSRPIVVSDQSVLEISVTSRTGNFLLSVDGRSVTLTQEQKICIKKASHTLQLVRLDGDSFISTLRHKLKWGTDPRKS